MQENLRMEELKINGLPGTQYLFDVSKFCRDSGCTDTGRRIGNGDTGEYCFFLYHETGNIDPKLFNKYPILSIEKYKGFKRFQH